MRKRKDIKVIEQKIKELTEQKNELVRQQADILFKKAQSILGDMFSPELVLTILSETWKKADTKQKEHLQSSALSFRSSRTSKIKITNEKNNSRDQSIESGKELGSETH